MKMKNILINYGIGTHYSLYIITIFPYLQQKNKLSYWYGKRGNTEKNVRGLKNVALEKIHVTGIMMLRVVLSWFQK